jgi:hypothetical protein
MAPTQATKRLATFLLFGSVITSCLFILQEHLDHAGNPGKPGLLPLIFPPFENRTKSLRLSAETMRGMIVTFLLPKTRCAEGAGML